MIEMSPGRKLHNVSGLAVQSIADSVQRAEAYGAYFSCFYFGKIYNSLRAGTKDDWKSIKNCLPCRIIQIIQKSEGGSSIIVGTVDKNYQVELISGVYIPEKACGMDIDEMLNRANMARKSIVSPRGSRILWRRIWQ